LNVILEIGKVAHGAWLEMHSPHLWIEVSYHVPNPVFIFMHAPSTLHIVQHHEILYKTGICWDEKIEWNFSVLHISTLSLKTITWCRQTPTVPLYTNTPTRLHPCQTANAISKYPYKSKLIMLTTFAIHKISFLNPSPLVSLYLWLLWSKNEM
jgi:hypothetical protein